MRVRRVFDCMRKQRANDNEYGNTLAEWLDEERVISEDNEQWTIQWTSTHELEVCGEKTGVEVTTSRTIASEQNPTSRRFALGTRGSGRAFMFSSEVRERRTGRSRSRSPVPHWLPAAIRPAHRASLDLAADARTRRANTHKNTRATCRHGIEGTHIQTHIQMVPGLYMLH